MDQSYIKLERLLLKDTPSLTATVPRFYGSFRIGAERSEACTPTSLREVSDDMMPDPRFRSSAPDGASDIRSPLLG